MTARQDKIIHHVETGPVQVPNIMQVSVFVPLFDTDRWLPGTAPERQSWVPSDVSVYYRAFFFFFLKFDQWNQYWLFSCRTFNGFWHENACRNYTDFPYSWYLGFKWKVQSMQILFFFFFASFIHFWKTKAFSTKDQTNTQCPFTFLHSS